MLTIKQIELILQLAHKNLPVLKTKVRPLSTSTLKVAQLQPIHLSISPVTNTVRTSHSSSVALALALAASTLMLHSTSTVRSENKARAKVLASTSTDSKRISLPAPSYPSPYEYLLLSSAIYHDDPDSTAELESRGWRQLSEFHPSIHNEMWCHEAARQVVVVYRGTVPTTLDDMKFNALGIVRNQMQQRVVEALYYLQNNEALKTLLAQGYRLSFTGHSQGGFAAEFSVYACKRKDLGFYYPFASAVVFDSLGSLQYLEKHIASNLPSENSVDLAQLNILSFLSHVNLVNTFDKHPGIVCHLKPRLPGKSLYLLEAHSIKNMKDCFDEHTEIPKAYKAMSDWPLASYEELKPSTLVGTAAHYFSLNYLRSRFSKAIPLSLPPFFTQIGGDQYRKYFELTDAKNNDEVAKALELALYAHFRPKPRSCHRAMLDDEVQGFINDYRALSAGEKSDLSRQLQKDFITLPSEVDKFDPESVVEVECSNPFQLRNDLTKLAYYRLKDLPLYIYLRELLKRNRDQLNIQVQTLEYKLDEVSKNFFIDPKRKAALMEQYEKELKQTREKLSVLDLRIGIGPGAGSTYDGFVHFNTSTGTEIPDSKTLEEALKLRDRNLERFSDNKAKVDSGTIDGRIGLGEGAASNYHGSVFFGAKPSKPSTDKKPAALPDHEDSDSSDIEPPVKTRK